MMFDPKTGDPVRLNKSGEALFKRQIKGTVASVDPNDQTAVRVRIITAGRSVFRTISLRNLEADNG